MRKIILLIAVFSASISTLSGVSRKEVSDHLQGISVTIKSEGRYSRSEGSGVLVVREIEGKKVTFVWTAAHVIDNLRSVREIVDESGNTRKVVEFKDPEIVKELVEDGRRVGEIKMAAKVIKYSDYTHGHDLALLMVRAKDYGREGAKFYLDAKEPIIAIGTPLYHVGSLMGQFGSNSMTSGILSQVGRIHGKVEFDQTTVTAFPGSSGGGVYLQDGRYMGMLVRGAGENFNLMVPVRRMKKWAQDNSILWAIDPKVKVPKLDHIDDLPIEGKGEIEKKEKKGKEAEFSKRYPFLINIQTPEK